MPIALARQNRVGATDLALPPLGFGSAHLGGMYHRVDGDTARATLKAAWDGGIRYFDTAPFYGRGLSEHRLGNFLMDQPRDAYVLTSKIGRVFRRPTDPANFDMTPWGGGIRFEFEFDYTYDGVMRSYEQSLFRLGIDTIDALLIHDPDRAGHGDMHETRMKNLAESGIKALENLKRSGDIKAIGMGLNRTESVDTIPRLVDLDFLIVAMPYTLLDQSALYSGMQRCMDKNISVIIGAPFASGILATGPGPDARYGYGLADEAIQKKAGAIRRVCASHGVSLATAALQFPLGHPAVVSVIPGSARPEEVTQNIASMTESVPAGLWAQLKQEGLILEETPVPG